MAENDKPKDEPKPDWKIVERPGEVEKFSKSYEDAERIRREAERRIKGGDRG